MKNYRKALLLLCFFAISFVPSGGKATLSVVKGNAGLSISGSPSKIIGYEECRMNTHVHTSACGSTPPTGGHTETDVWPSKRVAVAVSGVVSGYGYAGGAFTLATIDGKKVADQKSYIGEQSEALKQVGVCGFIGTSPKAYTEDISISFSIYGDSKETPRDQPHHWSATGGIYIRPIVWLGTASSSVEVGALATLKLPPELQVSGKGMFGQTMSYQQGRDRAWTGTDSSGTWQIEYKYRCRHCSYRSGSAALSDSHSHHFVCGGCQKHVACRYNPGIHQMDATCPQSGCNATNVWRCVSHTCPTPIGSTSPSGSIPPQTPPPDDTPNCPDCTSHCSSPCSCSNSGTCNGTVTDNTPDCSYCTDGCSSCDSTTDETPNCPDCTSHCSSPCSCTNSGTCNGSAASPAPPPTPPSTLVQCSACGGSYDTSWHSSFVEWHTVVKTCEHCGMEFQRCWNHYGFCYINGTHVEND